MKKCFLICVLLFFSAGCLEELVHDDTALTTALQTVEALAIANTASAPVNPYAAPIGIGLAGVIAMLEALRRKERSARKFAESNNHVPDKTRVTDVSKFPAN